MKINASTNVPAANIAIAKGEVNYVSAGDEWISDIVISEDKVSFEVAENNTGAVRQAIVSITFPVAEWDSPITAMVAVTQSATPASFGQVPTTVVADPNGINPISIELQPSFTPSLYGFGVDYSLSYTDGQVVDWLRNPTIDAKSFKFTAEPKPNPYPARTAVVTFRLLSASGAELSTSTVTITQDKSDMGTTEGGNDNGEEPKDPEEDF